ncbi:MAG: hypothetical protein D3917_00965 [Candidatus Electrothrix sp. AX5]|nr:hypothetical protein [Candidatus Electrothrix sp. AX5]
MENLRLQQDEMIAIVTEIEAIESNVKIKQGLSDLKHRLNGILQENPNIAKATKLLPAWFIPRMMDDVWQFGILLSTNEVLAVEHIDDVHQASNGDIWIDVTMCTETVEYHGLAQNIITSPTSRPKASINTSHIIAALELHD